MRSSLLFAAIATVTGCSFLVGLDGLTGSSGSSADLPQDGQAEAQDAGSSDAADDGQNGSWCATHGSGHKLCLDFESGEAGSDWDVTEARTGTVTVVSIGANKVLQTKTTPYSDNGPAAFISKRFFESVTAIDCELDLNIVDGPGGVAWVTFDAPTGGYVGLTENELAWQSGGGTPSQYFPGPGAQWVRAKLTTNIKTGTASVSFDGIGGTSLTIPSMSATSTKFYFGIQYPPPNSTLVRQYDNILCDITP